MAGSVGVKMVDVKHIQLPISANPSFGDSPAVAEETLRKYFADGFVLFDVTISNVSKDGFFATYVLVKYA